MKLALIMALCALSAFSQAEQPGASKGKFHADRADVKAATELLPEDRRKKILDDVTQWKPVLEEALTLREWMSSDLRKSLTDAERAGVRYRAESADLQAGLDAYIGRAIRDLLAKPDVLDARAREIWLGDEKRFFTPEAADIIILFINAGQRGLAGATARYREIERQLKRGVKLEALVPKYADRVPGQKEILPARMRVELRSIDAAARRAIFGDMKEGEIRGPIPAPEGWLVIQLVKKHPPEKLPYEEVKDAIVERLLQEAGQLARLSVMAKLTETPIQYDEALNPPKGDPEKNRAAALAAETVQKELRDRKITPEQAASRLRELLSMGTAAQPTETTPTSPSTPNKQ